MPINNSEVFCCLLDFSKAFDKVNFDSLFQKLLDRNFPAIFLRLITYIYNHQSCFIRWNSTESSLFKVKNGVRQGAILSPSLFCIYLDTLLARLRDAGVGCHIGGMYLGAFGYADDVTLLAPSRQALQLMLDICEDFATSHSMLFSTDPNPARSKTKCLFFSRKRNSEQVSPVTLNGDTLPWVTTAKHLGNHLSSKLSLASYSPETKTDILCKRAILFDKVHQVLQQFGNLEPKLVINLLSIYSTALYGSTLWQIDSEEYKKLIRSWNIAVKIIWELPHPTHVRLLEPLSPVPHLEAVLTGRYIGFIENLSKSAKPSVRMLFDLSNSDLSSQTGQNIGFLLGKHSKQTWGDLIRNHSSIKKQVINPIPETEKWKAKIVEEIALIQKGFLEADFEDTLLAELLEYLCTD